MTLIVHRDSRTEALAGLFARALDANRPANPLAPQMVVVAHSGLRRWLLGVMAHRAARGIAANFDMMLPWQWLQRIASELLGEAALIDGAWRTESLRWHIYAALTRIDAPQVRAYLHGDDAERRRFQLADHLAGIYTQYLIYRPDWIQAWEQGAERDNWQARLWRALRQAIEQPHRAQRRDALVAALQRHHGDTSPLHVFGVSHLAPDVLAALHAASARRAVNLYFPDPCRQYWADLATPRAALKRQPEGDDLYYEIGHPLLVSLGRMGQDFFIQLDALGVELGGDEDEEAVTPTLLGAVQASIRNCTPTLVAARSARGDDTSLRVHACHTRLRELEVLKDALLGLLADNAELQHRDIVVMAPNIAAYAPYLAAVFGAPARYAADRAQIPWHLADVGLANTHPLLAAFSRILDLADSRFAFSEIMDFLDVPALARRFGIDRDARDALEPALRRARIAWGLDAPMKAQAGAAAVDQNSWAFGFDRLYAGLVAGEDADDALLDGILPLPGVGGGEAEAIGRLDRLLDALRQIRDGMGTPRSLLAWRDWLLEQIDRLFLGAAHDEAEAGALEALRRIIAALGDQADAAGAAALPWRVVREAARGELARISERQPFLLGGVTFCGLVPQRSIPFRVICLLGMNEGEFPRQAGGSGLNLMLEHPRRGDRDTRREDRYLLLEALMAARDHLHISYIGEGVHDGKPRNPASPLNELLQFLDAQCGCAGDAPRPWLVRHPLQPFDARYFDRSDPRLFSFDPAFATNAMVVVNTTFIDLHAEQRATPASREISLGWLKRFWRDPAKALLRDDAGVSLDALDAESWPDREPLKATMDAQGGIERQLLFAALTAGHAQLPPSAPDWLGRSGMLAAGAAGERAYANARTRVQAALAAARDFLGDSTPCVQAVDLDFGGIHITGSVDAFRDASGRVRLFGAKPVNVARFNELLPFYFDFAALRLILPDEVAAEYIEYAKDNKVPVRTPKLLASILKQDRLQLRTGLQRLASAAVTASASGFLFPPRTAWEWAMAKADRRASAAQDQWEGDEFHPGERSYTPGYTALLARDFDFADAQSPAHARFVQTCALVCAALDPSREILLSAAVKSGKRAR